jgi:hypothetical protein
MRTRGWNVLGDRVEIRIRDNSTGIPLAAKVADEVYSVFLKPLAAEIHRDNCITRGSFQPHRCVWIEVRTGLNIGD